MAKVDSTPMKQSNRIPVAIAYLHQAIMIPAVINSEKHLGKESQRVTLEWGPEGLWIIPNDAGKPISIVPQANVANVVLK